MSAAARVEPPASAPVRAVLLDAFGTLLTLESPAIALREELMSRLGVAVSEAEAGAALGAEVAFYRAHLHLGCDEAGLAALRRRCGEVLRANLPAGPALLAAPPEQIDAVLHAALRFRVYPEVPATLASLREAGLALVVVSNWDCSLEQVLARAGLRPWLDGVVSSAVVGAPKPDPLPLRRGLALVGVTPAQAVHVGDSESEDVDGALAAGVRPLLLRRGGERGGEPGGRGRVATITSLAELPALLL